MSTNINCCLRMDDVGASSKLYEVYSKSRIGNILFLKYIKPFKAWGVYNELDAEEWRRIIEILDKYKSKLTIGLTAAWVEKDGSLIPYPEKFYKESEILKQALESNIIEIANHGLTHCIVGEHLPKTFTSNRIFHREFWNWLPESIHFNHIRDSQKILNDWLSRQVTSLIPPGNVYSYSTIEAAYKNGINLINANKILQTKFPVRIRDLKNIVAFHDREIKLLGIDWFEKLVIKHADKKQKFLKEL